MTSETCPSTELMLFVFSSRRRPFAPERPLLVDDGRVSSGSVSFDVVVGRSFLPIAYLMIQATKQTKRRKNATNPKNFFK